jgi:hypothetical protein
MIRKQNKNHYELKDNNKIIEQNRIQRTFTQNNIYILCMVLYLYIQNIHSGVFILIYDCKYNE